MVMLKKNFSQSQVPQMGTLKVTPQATKTRFPHHYSSFSLLPTSTSSTPAALGRLSHWPLSHHFSLSLRLNYFFELFAWQMTQVGIFRTCLVTSQQLQPRWVGLVGAFFLCKMQIFVTTTPDALGAASCEGFSAIQARSAHCGPEKAESWGKVQISLPLSESITKPGCSSPIPREMLSQGMVWRRQTSLHCCYRSSLLARQGAERGSSDAANSSDVCSWEVWKPPGFLLPVIHACGGCENHFQKAMSSLCSPGFKFKHLMQSNHLKNIV